MNRIAEEQTKRAFDQIGPNNPLRKLSPADRAYLWATLMIYERQKKSRPTPEEDPMERAAKVAVSAGKLANALDANIFGGPLAGDLVPFVAAFSSLPAQLRRFSDDLGTLFGHAGKAGRKHEVFANLWLVMASEFVQLKLGSFYDEHVAELFQGFGNCDPSLDFSGDAIRKKRDYLKKEYPLAYEQALAPVQRRSQN